MAPKKLEIVVSGRLSAFYNFLVRTLEKLLVFLVKYAHYTTFFIMKSLGKGALRGSESIMGISIISYGKNSLDLRPTSVTTSRRERIEFISQGATVLGFQFAIKLKVNCTRKSHTRSCRQIKHCMSHPDFQWHLHVFVLKFTTCML
jgi:hypothetical protein